MPADAGSQRVAAMRIDLHAPYALGVSDADRERDLRRLERDRRRRESGRATYFDQAGTSFAGAEMPTQETLVLRPESLEEGGVSPPGPGIAPPGEGGGSRRPPALSRPSLLA